MKTTVTTKYNIGNKFRYTDSWSNTDVECRIGAIRILFDKDGYNITYFFQKFDTFYNRWTELYNNGSEVHTNENEFNILYRHSIKEIEGETYTNRVCEIDTKGFELGDEVISTVNGCNVGEGTMFAGNIFLIDHIIYTVSNKYSFRTKDYEDYERIVFGRSSIDNLKVDGFGCRINDGRNCNWIHNSEVHYPVYKVSEIDWDNVMLNVIKEFKIHKENPFKKDQYSEWPYTVIFRYLGLEDKFEKEWDSYKLVLEKKTKKKKTKVDNILEGLSDKEKSELLKKLSK